MLTPSLYATLVDRASGEAAKNVEEVLIDRFESMARGLVPELTESLRTVYTAGVNDGFIQGVAAASEDFDTKLQVAEGQLAKIFAEASAALGCDAGTLLDLIDNIKQERNERG